MARTRTKGFHGYLFIVSAFPLHASAIEKKVVKARFIRVMNSVGDGNKIREFRERLGQAMNRFEVGGYYHYSC